jgi:hypothetical protein
MISCKKFRQIIIQTPHPEFSGSNRNCISGSNGKTESEGWLTLRDIANQECSNARVSAIQVLSHTTTFFCNSRIKATKQNLN